MCWAFNAACTVDWGATGTWAGVFVTIAALWIAVWQLRENARAAGQAHARQAWMAYLHLGAQYPQFGSTDVAMRILGVASVNELFTKGTVETERYGWFLDIMLEAMEALVNYFPDKAWQNTIEYNLDLHREAIEFRWPEIQVFYSAPLSRITEGVLNRPNPTAVEAACSNHDEVAA